MLLKKIELENFRQFENEKIEFSTDNNKNVTIIIGETGSGKTTLAQAFYWCLYGEVSFNDKIVLNKKLVNNLTPGRKETTRVNLSIIHNSIHYNIIREQEFSKNRNGKISPDNTTLNVQYKDRRGNQKFLKQLEIEPRIREIMPKELSKYFFFDGERIEKMSKEIQSNRKSQQFAEAVKGLLGLNAMSKALEHLSPKTTGLIGEYERSYDRNSNEKIIEYSKKINEYTKKLENINERLTDTEEKLDVTEQRKDKLSMLLSKHTEGKFLQEKKQNIINNISNNKKMININLENLHKKFHQDAQYYLLDPLIKESILLLKNKNLENKDIPEMHSKTIKFLIDQGTCLCGTEIKEGNEAYNKLLELMDYLPPHSIGITVGDFVKASTQIIDRTNNIYSDFYEYLKIIKDQTNKIERDSEEVKLIEDKLKNVKSVASYQQQLNTCNTLIRENNKEKDNLLEEKGSYETLKKRNISEKSKLTLKDENNKKIEIYKSYAQYMYTEINNLYDEKERETRELLEDTINKIFANIYGGGLSLTINENYSVTVNVDEYNDISDIETSTGQSILVIFAFITGIIDLAKKSNNFQDNMLYSEAYPLVMDAPLSVFDNKRIELISRELPEIAEQVIIFIKDTDGNKAKKFMKSKIGKTYDFVKNGQLKTVIEGGTYV